MSLASTGMRRTRGSRQRGFTVLEIVISLAILSTIALITEKAMMTTARTQRYLAAVRKATERGHTLTYQIRERVTSSRRLFFDDASGQRFLESMDLSRAPLVSWARLPAMDETGRLGPDDPSDPKTGNVLFFSAESDATPAVADPDNQQIRYIDSYTFICVYPTQTDKNVIVDDAPLQPALDLVVWESIALPDFAQIMAISDEDERFNVISDLQQTYGYTLAWDPTGAAESSFYNLDDLKGSSPDPINDAAVPEDGVRSRGGRLVYANVQLARANIDEKRRRPIFATEDPNVWLPHGFEVKIIGPTGGRQVWFHLVVETQSGAGEVAIHGSTIVANAKDL